MDKIEKIKKIYCKWCPHDCQITGEEKAGCLASGGASEEICQLFAPQAMLSRSVQRRIAAQKGEPAPTFATPSLSEQEVREQIAKFHKNCEYKFCEKYTKDPGYDCDLCVADYALSLTEAYYQEKYKGYVKLAK